MLRHILAGTTALALVMAFAAGASANPENRFGDNNTAAATAMADANGNSGAVGNATAYAQSFNSGIEVISVQEMTATVNGAPIVVFGGIGGAGGKGANGGDVDFAVAPSMAFAGGNGGGANGGALSSGATTVEAGAGIFGGIANINVASGYFNSALGGVSSAMHGIE